MLAEDIGLRWAIRIAAAFRAWAEEEKKSRTIEIKPFDPSPQISLAFYDAGASQLEDLGKLIGMGVKFDLRSKEAEAWIQEYSAKEIRYIDAGTRKTIQAVKLRSFQEGLTIQEQKALIRQYVGLLPQHAIAAENYKSTLLKSGMDRDTAERLTATYRKKLLNYRAKMIAVSEGMAASNEGIRKTNEDAMKRGILPASEYEMEWVASGLKRTCDKCLVANGSRAPIGGTFPNGSRGPPIHPGDRCSTVIVRKR